MAYQLKEKFETTSGNVYRKEVDPETGNARFRKNGSFTSPNSYSGASDHVEQRYVRDGQSEPDRPASIPVPSDDGSTRYVDVETRDAREIGKRIMADDEDLLPGQDSYELPNGETYTIDELAGAYLEADRDDSVVRYAI